MALFPTLALILLAQGEKPTATVKLASATAIVGQPVKGTLTLTIPEGMHGYQNPPADEYENPIKLGIIESGFKLVKVAYPKGASMTMEGAQKPTMVYEGAISIPFTFVATKPAARAVSFRIDYQLCTASSCFPPSSVVVKTAIKSVAAPKKGKA